MPLYTDLPENAALVETVRAISGPRESFATDFIDNGAQVPGAALRHQAEYSRREGLWHLVKTTRLGGCADLEGLLRQETLARTDCFFDALYWCSELQASGNPVPASGDDRDWLYFRHWQDVAQEAGQALADNGVAMPCADGRVLVDGFFREDQRMIAAKTSALALSPRLSLRQPPKIGELVKGEGVYLGIWESRDLAGVPLRQTLDIYAAPKDLQTWYRTRLFTLFQDAAEKTTALKNWHGHDGAPFESDKDVYGAVLHGRMEELGKWWIPTIDILCGHLRPDTIVQSNNLFEHRRKRAFKNTFPEQGFYLSCSRAYNESAVLKAGFKESSSKITIWGASKEGQEPRKYDSGFVRLVRAVPRR